MVLLNANKSFHGIGSVDHCAALFGFQEAIPEAELMRRLRPTSSEAVVIPYGAEVEQNGNVYVLAKALGTIAKGACVTCSASATEDAASLGSLHLVDINAGSVTAANMALETNFIKCTLPAAPANIFADEFYYGRILVNEGTGAGDMYYILGNSVTAAAAVATFYITPNVLTAASTDTELNITRNPYRGTQAAVAAGVCVPLGGAMAAATTTNNAYWICRWGRGAAIAGEALTHSITANELTIDTGTAGALEAKDAAMEIVVAELLRYTDGTSQVNIDDTDHFDVFWKRPNIS